MSWVAVAVAGGTTILGAVTANQKKQREKGFIDQNYQLQSKELGTQQANTAETTAESLNQRGMSPIASAMGVRAAPTTLGGKVQADEQTQFGLERQDLSNQRNQAQSENKAAYTNALIGSVVNGVSTAEGIKGAQMDSAAARTTAPTNSPIQRAMTVSSLPSTPGAFGIDAVHPLEHPDSAWNPANKRTLNGGGLSNADFNTGNA